MREKQRFRPLTRLLYLRVWHLSDAGLTHPSTASAVAPAGILARLADSFMQATRAPCNEGHFRHRRGVVPGRTPPSSKDSCACSGFPEESKAPSGSGSRCASKISNAIPVVITSPWQIPHWKTHVIDGMTTNGMMSLHGQFPIWRCTKASAGVSEWALRSRIGEMTLPVQDIEVGAFPISGLDPPYIVPSVPYVDCICFSPESQASSHSVLLRTIENGTTAQNHHLILHLQVRL